MKLINKIHIACCKTWLIFKQTLEKVNKISLFKLITNLGKQLQKLKFSNRFYKNSLLIIIILMITFLVFRFCHSYRGVIIIIDIIILGQIIFNCKLNLDKKTYKYITGIFVTSIGVLLAISISNINLQNNNREKSINLLEVVNHEFQVFYESIDEYNHKLFEGEGQNNTYMRYPKLIHDILKNDIVITTIRKGTFKTIITELHYIELNTIYFERASDIDSIIYYLESIAGSIRLIEEHIQNEIDYIRGYTQIRNKQ